jgi:DNA-directed RNA polymerase subunit RPC12/RpoP
MTEIRCKKCNRKLFEYYNDLNAVIYIKCPKCGYHQNVGLLGLQTKMERRDGIRRMINEIRQDRKEIFCS